jgi:phage terminase large subunit
LRIRLPNNWEPRSYQLPLWLALEQGKRFADVCWHRRAGKDDVCLHRAAVAAFERVGGYWHMLPEASQARKAIWDAINPHTGRRRIDEAFPVALRETVRENEMFIRFKNGSTWQVVGSDNFDSLVGSPPIGIVFSEWSLAKPDAWTYLRPILLENKGWALFIWTPRGRNHATRAFESREADPAWFTQRLSAANTGVFTAGQLAAERRAYIDECGSEEEGDSRYRQEYLVDFDAAAPGSYFGTLISQAREDGRIGDFPFDPSLKVQTAWDIGVADYTAIWFLQENGREVRAIDYYETSGDGVQQIAEVVKAKPWAAKYDRHFLPHDIMVREWAGGGKTRLETLRACGVTNVSIGQQRDPAERINATRRLLPSVSFDVACAAGIDRLRNYRKRWNDSLRQYVGPMHDENSHGADAFGEFAVNCQIVQRKTPDKPLDPPDRNQWRGTAREEVSNWVA